MLDYKIILGTAAVVAGIIQYLPYIRDILAGRTKPHAFSWFVWGLPCGIVFAAQLLEGAAAGAWATGITAALCTVIFLMSLYKGERNITRSDWICLILALLAIALWGATNDPLWAVILITLADVLGFIPTFRKSIAKPYEETLSTPIVGVVKYLFSLAAMSSFTLTVLLYPVAMIFFNGLLAGMLIVRRRAVPPPAKA